MRGSPVMLIEWDGSRRQRQQRGPRSPLHVHVRSALPAYTVCSVQECLRPSSRPPRLATPEVCVCSSGIGAICPYCCVEVFMGSSSSHVTVPDVSPPPSHPQESHAVEVYRAHNCTSPLSACTSCLPPLGGVRRVFSLLCVVVCCVRFARSLSHTDILCVDVVGAGRRHWWLCALLFLCLVFWLQLLRPQRTHRTCTCRWK